MFFEDYRTHKTERISPAILWDYDITSTDWDWNKMAKTVVQRVIERGRKEDYYAMLQMYGGFEGVREIVKKIPYLTKKDMNWCCVLFGVEKESLWSYNRMLSRKKRLGF